MEYEESELPSVLNDIILDYIDIDDLVTLSLGNDANIPSASDWTTILKRRFPLIYHDFITQEFDQHYTPDQVTTMIMAGLYRQPFGPPLTNIITTDAAMKLYLILTQRYNLLDPQTMYDVVKTHIFQYNMIESILYLVWAGADPHPYELNALLKLTPIDEIITVLFNRHGSRIFRVDIGQRSLYQGLVHQHPDVALRFINDAEISWDDFNTHRNRLLFAAPVSQYDSLFQAYYERIGPIPITEPGVKPNNVGQSIRHRYPNLSLSLQCALGWYAEGMEGLLRPRFV